MTEFLNEFQIFMNMFVNNLGNVWNWYFSTIIGKINIFIIIIIIFITFLGYIVNIKK